MISENRKSRSDYYEAIKNRENNPVFDLVERVHELELSVVEYEAVIEDLQRLNDRLLKFTHLRLDKQRYDYMISEADEIIGDTPTTRSRIEDISTKTSSVGRLKKRKRKSYSSSNISNVKSNEMVANSPITTNEKPKSAVNNDRIAGRKRKNVIEYERYQLLKKSIRQTFYSNMKNMKNIQNNVNELNEHTIKKNRGRIQKDLKMLDDDFDFAFRKLDEYRSKEEEMTNNYIRNYRKAIEDLGIGTLYDGDDRTITAQKSGTVYVFTQKWTWKKAYLRIDASNVSICKSEELEMIQIASKGLDEITSVERWKRNGFSIVFGDPKDDDDQKDEKEEEKCSHNRKKMKKSRKNRVCFKFQCDTGHEVEEWIGFLMNIMYLVGEEFVSSEIHENDDD